MTKVIISCDGGARIKPNVPREAIIGGFGVVMVYGEHRKEIHEGHLGVTNNQMEIMAVTRGLELIKNPSMPVEVQSDSAYVINAITKGWIEKWMTNGWLKSNKQPVENVELWKKLYYQIERFSFIQFVKVKGHSGNELNERADLLANIAMNDLTTKLKEEAVESVPVVIDDTIRRKFFEEIRAGLSYKVNNLAAVFQNGFHSIPVEEFHNFVRDCNQVQKELEDWSNRAQNYLKEMVE